MLIFLIGYMGSGKSTAGKKLAKLLGYGFADLDEHIEKRSGRRIADIFALEGEEGFRKYEHIYLEKLCKLENHVIATGGGTPCFGKNLELMKNSGKVVYLKMPAAALAKRLSQSDNTRPLLKNTGNKSLENYIEEHLAQREKFYEQADVIVNGVSVDVKELAKQLIATE
jgi:shikimate kinase